MARGRFFCQKKKMDLNSNSSSYEEEDSAVDLPQPPAQAAIDPDAATEIIDVHHDGGIEEVEVEAVWEEVAEEASRKEALEPRTLGVPGLKTLMPGDLVEVLWAHGA